MHQCDRHSSRADKKEENAAVQIALREMSDKEIQEILAARDNAANVETSNGASAAV
jgi:hypothetical protein